MTMILLGGALANLNLVLPDGNDPPYPVLQTVANPSQLKEHYLVPHPGLEPGKSTF